MKNYKIVVDSCCDLPKEYHHDPRIEIVPLVLEVGGYHTMDDDNFDQADFLKRVEEYEGVARSACPSPDRYLRAYETDAEDVYVVTLSAKLSGSYNSAVLGKNLYEEEHPHKNIFVVDSKSASCGETQVAFRLLELAERGLPFSEVVTQICRFRDEMNTYFVLDNLNSLRKNGRLTGVKSLVASSLSIKPVMGSHDGAIVQKGQGIGTRKAMMKLVDLVTKEVKNPEEKTLMIAHINCYERAMVVKDMVLARNHFKDVLVVDGAGVSTLYANDGGIILTC